VTLFLDTSVIIDHLSNRLTPAVEVLRGTISHRGIIIGDLVLMEVLQGLRGVQVIAQTERALAGYPCFELGGTEQVRAAAAAYRLLRSKGITPRSTIDVLIASFCVREDLELLASDRDFRLMAPHIGLRLAGPLLS
jgi:predicted nucleic acid-binding protein